MIQFSVVSFQFSVPATATARGMEARVAVVAAMVGGEALLDPFPFSNWPPRALDTTKHGENGCQFSVVSFQLSVPATAPARGMEVRVGVVAAMVGGEDYDGHGRTGSV